MTAVAKNSEQKDTEKPKMKPYLPLVQCCEPCLKTEKTGKFLRGAVVISNILYWFAGCAVFSIAVWLRFVDVASTQYYSSFEPFDIAMYVILINSILILVISFVGTCAANTKSQPMIAIYTIALVIVFIAQIVALIVYVQSHDEMQKQFGIWFNSHFNSQFHSNDTRHKDIVDHIQAKIGCCGSNGVNDYIQLTSDKSIPPSCTKKSKFRKMNIIQPEVYSQGCVTMIDEYIDWLFRGYPIPLGMTFLLLIEIIGVASSLTYLLHTFVRRYYSYNDEDEESNGLISKSKKLKSTFPAIQDSIINSPLTAELPKPKVFRIPKTPQDISFGFSVIFDYVKTAHVTHSVEKGSNAEYARLTPNCHIIEINGMMVHGISSEEVSMKMELADSELRMLVIEESASIIYKTNKVAVNLRNVQGVTSLSVDYRPRLCAFKKGVRGFGFHLLYLEDRKGEFIEDIAANGPAEEAGLRIGDRIVEVNGINIEREKSKEVVSRIRSSGESITMLVLDPKADGYYRKKAVTVTSSLAVDYFANQVQQNSTPKRRKSHRDVKPRYCRLVKGAREDFGLYVVIDNARIGQVVRWVDCGGPADRAGLHIGDRIIEVNGQNVEYESHQKLIDAISLSKKASHFIVVDEEYDKVFKRNKPRLCRIFKERGMFGFAVNFFEKKDGHYVDEVDPDGPADRAGLKVGDRVIQINSCNVSQDSNDVILNRLRACETEVILLVIDSRSDKHYKNIRKFKQTGMDDVDYDTISIPEEPLFLPDVEEDSESQISEQMTLTMADSISMAETKSFISVATGATTQTGNESILSEDPDAVGPRVCNLIKMDHEDHGFFLVVDRDRNGQVIQRIEPGGPADLAGLKNGDRILSVNNNKVDGFTHEQVVQIIKSSGNEIAFVVLDARSDNLNSKRRPYLFRLMKGEGGYGFYMWYDDNGHFVEDITLNSPADKAGLRAGDRIVEINGVNIEKESHEDVFYRVKACTNTVTLLSVDAKTFAYYKRNNIPVSAFKAETGFSGYQAPVQKKQENVKTKAVTVQQDIKIVKSENETFGFHLAYSESFMDDDSSGNHVIHWVEKGGPADVAGIRNGDKIVAFNGKNVNNEEHEIVYAKIFEDGKNTIILTTEFENTQAIGAPHTVEITKENESLGFYLWFDENGHYIEDVTFGSAADKSGLKIGDRLMEVNGVDIEDEPHAAVVALVKDSGEKVNLTVINIDAETPQGNILPSTLNVVKYQGSFGFSIAEDSKGFHFDMILPDGAADNLGIMVGDRLLEVNGESVTGLDYGTIVSIIKAAITDINLTVMSSTMNTGGSIGRISGKKILGDTVKHSDKKTSNVFKQLLEQDKIDYVVEKRKYQEAQGTDLRNIKTKDESETENENTSPKKAKSKKKNSKQHKKATRIKYGKGDDNIAFVNEIEDEDFAVSINKEYDKSSKDSEGTYLDDKVKRAGILAAKRRKPQRNSSGRSTPLKTPAKSEKRQQNLNAIESKLGSTKYATSRRQKRSQAAQNNKNLQTLRGFHMIPSRSALGQQWNFEQTDSRKPGEIISVNVENRPEQITRRQLNSIVEEDDYDDTLSQEPHELQESDTVTAEENDKEQGNAGNPNDNTTVIDQECNPDNELPNNAFTVEAEVMTEDCFTNDSTTNNEMEHSIALEEEYEHTDDASDLTSTENSVKVDKEIIIESPANSDASNTPEVIVENPEKPNEAVEAQDEIMI